MLTMPSLISWSRMLVCSPHCKRACLPLAIKRPVGRMCNVPEQSHEVWPQFALRSIPSWSGLAPLLLGLGGPCIAVAREHHLAGERRLNVCSFWAKRKTETLSQMTENECAENPFSSTTVWRLLKTDHVVWRKGIIRTGCYAWVYASESRHFQVLSLIIFVLL